MGRNPEISYSRVPSWFESGAPSPKSKRPGPGDRLAVFLVIRPAFPFVPFQQFEHELSCMALLHGFVPFALDGLALIDCEGFVFEFLLQAGEIDSAESDPRLAVSHPKFAENRLHGPPRITQGRT
jgi:hypothetical protein